MDAGTKDNSAPAIGYCPWIKAICSICNSKIYKGQLQFKSASEGGESRWNHFLCMLKPVPGRSDLMMLSGLATLWSALYSVLPSNCSGYHGLKKHDKSFFKESLDGVSSALVQGKRAEETRIASLAIRQDTDKQLTPKPTQTTPAAVSLYTPNSRPPADTTRSARTIPQEPLLDPATAQIVTSSQAGVSPENGPGESDWMQYDWLQDIAVDVQGTQSESVASFVADASVVSIPKEETSKTEQSLPSASRKADADSAPLFVAEVADSSEEEIHIAQTSQQKRGDSDLVAPAFQTVKTITQSSVADTDGVKVYSKLASPQSSMLDQSSAVPPQNIDAKVSERRDPLQNSASEAPYVPLRIARVESQERATKEKVTDGKESGPRPRSVSNQGLSTSETQRSSSVVPVQPAGTQVATKDQHVIEKDTATMSSGLELKSADSPFVYESHGSSIPVPMPDQTYSYFVGKMKKPAKCVNCAAALHGLDSSTKVSPGFCAAGDLVLGLRKDENTFGYYRHLHCLTVVDLTSLSEEWTFIGIDKSVDEWIAGFDKLSSENRAKFHSCIKTRENKFLVEDEGKLNPSRESDVAPKTHKRKREESSSPGIKSKRRRVRRPLAVTSPEVDDHETGAEPLKCILLQYDKSENAPNLAAGDIALCHDDDDVLWVLTWGPESPEGKARVSQLSSLNKQTNRWRTISTGRQKVGKWAYLDSPAFLVPEPIPYMHNISLSCLTSPSGRPYMLVHGVTTKWHHDWIYIDLTSGIWWQQNPEKDEILRLTIGHAMASESQMVELACEASKAHHKLRPRLTVFDIPSQKWLEVEAFPFFGISFTPNSCELNRLAIMQEHLFFLLCPPKITGTVEIDRLVYIALLTADERNKSGKYLSKSAKDRCFIDLDGDIPTNVSRGALHILDLSTLVLTGHSNHDRAQQLEDNPITINGLQRSDNLRIWRCKLSKPVTAFPHKKKSIRGQWTEVKYTEYLPNPAVPQHIHCGFVHGGKVCLLGFSGAAGTDSKTNVRFELDLEHIIEATSK